jgi:hypothetical protein
MFQPHNWLKSQVRGRLIAVIGFTALALTGCERRERVLEIRTPEGDVTVDRIEREDDRDRVEVDVNER